jgi:hypothetical protein
MLWRISKASEKVEGSGGDQRLRRRLKALEAAQHKVSVQFADALHRSPTRYVAGDVWSLTFCASTMRCTVRRRVVSFADALCRSLTPRALRRRIVLFRRCVLSFTNALCNSQKRCVVLGRW